mmetsp:Transcript_57328/g.185765  ORF Transcript_57328/g.185765 Transcript_57328/m.185765 type:complete len:471 (+) Transcript_57328:378-1790(+)
MTRGYAELLRIIDFRDDTALDEALAQHSEIPRAELCRRGVASAVLPEGVYFTDLQEHHQMLLYELSYRQQLKPADLSSAASVERDFLQPLRSMREAWCANANVAGTCGQNWWWEEPKVSELVARSLANNKFAVLDGFLPQVEFAALAAAALAEFEAGGMARGAQLSGLATGDVRGDVQNAAEQTRKWTIRGDFSSIWSDSDSAAVANRALTTALDALIMGLKHPGGGDAAIHEVADRLQCADFREETMVACYPGASRARYHPHIDNDRSFIHRVLTAILYLNADWSPERDGGHLRLFNEGRLPLPQPAELGVKYDVVPQGNRLLLFWATEEVPHEVLPTRRDRYACTIWLVDGPRSASDPKALQRAAANPHQLHQLRTLAACLPRQGPHGPTMAEEILSRSLLRASTATESFSLDRPCDQCGARGGLGAPGVDAEAGKWFCAACWRHWAASLEFTPRCEVGKLEEVEVIL